MHASLRALLHGLIDHAGMFPPARMPLPDAVRQYLAERGGDEGWMLGRFICPADRLTELDPFADELTRAGVPLPCAALGRGGADARSVLDGLRADLEAIRACRERHPGAIVVDVLETRIPAELVKDRVAAVRLLNDAATLLHASRLTVFLEAPTEGAVDLEHWLHLLAHAPFDQRVGYKLRCGGLEAAAFPSSEQVARVLAACVRRQTPFKATAGLHHPLPRFDSGVQARMHGFVNLFVAGVLLHATGCDEATAAALLDDTEAYHFHFTDAGVRWGGLEASVEAIHRARREAVLSFGSCSFDEPRTDLRALNWL